jgi:arsenate reductase
MTDIFLSYSSKDRDRVALVHEALIKVGFEVFWDQTVPAGLDWDTWIRQQLSRAKCTVVVWSRNSVASDNVRHEATVAKQHQKLVPLLLDPLTADQFPMGLYAVQAADLSSWAGNLDSGDWQKLQDELENKLVPQWVARRIHALEAGLIAERARRTTAESRDRALQDQIAKEVTAQHQIERERDAARSEVEKLKASLEDYARKHAELEAEKAELLRQLEGVRAARPSIGPLATNRQAPQRPVPPPPPKRQYRVLFVGTTNSARSIIAEAILNKIGGGAFEAHSGGVRPQQHLHPQAVKLLRELGYDTSALRSKSWNDFAKPGAAALDYVFTLSDADGDSPPPWPGQPMTAHWPIPDPVRSANSPTEAAQAFNEAYRMLFRRIELFVASARRK